MLLSIVFTTFTIMETAAKIILYICIMGVLPFKYLYERTWVVNNYCIIGILKIIGYLWCVINFILFGALLYYLMSNTYKLQIQDYAVVAISYFGIIVFTEIIRFIEFLIDKNFRMDILLDENEFKMECNNLVELTYRDEHCKIIDNYVNLLYNVSNQNHSKKINSESRYAKFKIKKYEVDNKENSCYVYLKLVEKVKYDLFGL